MHAADPSGLPSRRPGSPDRPRRRDSRRVDSGRRLVIIDPKTVPATVSYRVLVGSVVPRPIAFVSTTSPAGVNNLAPFSFFNAVCGDPPVVLFCPVWRDPMKDTLANVRATNEFVVNIVSEGIVEQMNVC